MYYSETIKRMRKERGLTQQELADALGVSRSSIGMYESGTREPNFEMCKALADFFNCRLSDIIEEAPANKGDSMTLGQRIKSAREKKGMTLEEVAKMCNTTKQTIFKYENEIVTNIPYDKILLLSSALSVSPSYLFGWDECTEAPATYHPNTRITSCGQRIAAALARKGMKQADVARLTGIPKSALSQYISGAFEPKQDRIELLARTFGVSEVWLMGYDVPDSANDTNKTSPAGIDEGLLDEQIIERLCRLSPEELAKVDAFVQGLLANH